MTQRCQLKGSLGWAVVLRQVRSDGRGVRAPPDELRAQDLRPRGLVTAARKGDVSDDAAIGSRNVRDPRDRPDLAVTDPEQNRSNG